MREGRDLPPGQRAIDRFPRFGLSRFAYRFPQEPQRIKLAVQGDVETGIVVDGEELVRELPRIEQTSDFHCVTTWTKRSLRWSGFRFADFFERIVLPRANPAPESTFVILRGQDGAGSSLPLSDLLLPGILLADTLDGEPLSIAHGAPLRLIAPDHYGYKSVKHLKSIGFWRNDRNFRPSAFRFMDHPRARAAHEERGRGVPGVLLRYLYRPLIGPTVRRFARALERNAVKGK